MSMGRKGILFWLVEFKGEPFPRKRKKGATGPLGCHATHQVSRRAVCKTLSRRSGKGGFVEEGTITKFPPLHSLVSSKGLRFRSFGELAHQFLQISGVLVSPSTDADTSPRPKFTHPLIYLLEPTPQRLNVYQGNSPGVSPNHRTQR